MLTRPRPGIEQRWRRTQNRPGTMSAGAVPFAASPRLQRQVGRTGVLQVPDPVLGAGPEPVGDLELGG
jgi:hypothetical protein